MSSDTSAAALVWGAILLIFVVIVGVSMYQNRRGAPPRPTRSMPGAGAYGTIYDLLNQDKRNAIEMIVEEKAEARDPEDADGNLPELERPPRKT
jgi:hypothetical protein